MNRDYHAESERQLGVENFYRINHINQTYDFVRNRDFFLLSKTLFLQAQSLHIKFTGEKNERGVWETE